MKKRIVAVLIVAMMLIALMPTTAFAEVVLTKNVTTYDENGNLSSETGGSVTEYSYTIPFVGSYWRITAHEADGFFFDHWENDLNGSDATQSLKKDGNKTVTAVFKKKYTLSLSAGDNGMLTTPGLVPKTYKPGETASIGLANPTSDNWWHYEFAGWQDNNNPSAPLLDRWSDITMNANKSFTAIFKGLKNWKFTVTVKGNTGGTLGNNINGKYEYGSTVDLNTANPIPDSTNGYVFSHWEEIVDGDWRQCGANVTSGEVNDFRAVFQLKDCKVTYKDSQGDELGTETVQYGGQITNTANSFSYDEGEQPTKDQPWLGMKITDDTTITVNTKYKVTFDPNGGEIKGDGAVQWVAYNGNATEPTVEPPTGKHFATPKWDNSFENVKKAITAKAQYDVNTYTVSFIDQNDDPFGEPQPVEHGQDAQKPALVDAAGTQYDENITAWEDQLLGVTEGRTIQVALKYKVTFNPDGGTMADDDKEQWVAWDGNASDPDVTPPTGKHLASPKWDKLLTGITAPVTATAQYETNEYTVTYDAGTYGGFTPGTSETEQVLHDASPAAVPESAYTNALVPGVKVQWGYELIGWSSDGGATVLTKTQLESEKIVGDVTYVAQYAYKGSMALTVVVKTDGADSSAGGSVASSRGYSILYPMKTELEATANAGYHFVSFEVDGKEKTWTPIWVTMDDNKTVTANFATNQYTISYDKTTGSGTQMTDSSHAFSDGSTLSLNTYKKSGYYFDGWALTQGGPVAFEDGADTSTIIAENGESITLYAVWKSNSYGLTYNSNPDDVPTGLRTYRVYHKDTDTSAYPVKIGYKIYKSSDPIKDIGELKPDNTSSNPLIVNTNQIGVDSSETFVLYWYDKDNDKWEQAKTMASNTLYQVTFDPNGGEFSDGSAPKYDYSYKESSNPADGVTSPDLPTKEAFVFVGWDVDGNDVIDSNDDLNKDGKYNAADIDALEVSASMTIKAIYKPYTFKVKPNNNLVNGQVWVSYYNEVHVLNKGESVTYTAVPGVDTVYFRGIPDSANGYEFDRWHNNAHNDVPYTTGGPNGERQLNIYTNTTYGPYPHFKLKEYTVEFVDHDGKSLKLQHNVTHGTAATAPADPSRNGYDFTGWDVDYNNVTDNLTVNATYKLKEYIVEFVDYDGTVKYSETVEHFASATAPAHPDSRTGYSPNGWIGDYTNIEPPAGTTVITITADYTINNYNLLVT